MDKPIYLTSLDCDKYLVAGVTDHVTPWLHATVSPRSYSQTTVAETLPERSCRADTLTRVPGGASTSQSILTRLLSPSIESNPVPIKIGDAIIPTRPLR